MSSTSKIEQRLAALEAEAADLRALLAGNKEINPPAPQTQHQDSEVSITELAEPLAMLPSTEQLRKLHAIVLAQNPQLKTGRRLPRSYAPDLETSFADFAAAFRGLALLRRTEKPDRKRAAVFWIEEALERMRLIGRSSDFSLPEFIAAAIAHGDITHTPLENYPYGVELGLAIGGAGRPYTGDAWRQILRTGQFDASMIIETKIRRPTVSELNINIAGGDRWVG